MNISLAATLLGAAGLIPFWAFALAAHLWPNIDLAYKAVEAEIIWGSVILSFMAGARWAMILKADGSTLRLSGFALMSLPALVAPFFALKLALGLLAIAFFAPGSPWENGYCESFNSRFRDELLNGEVFTTLCEAQILIERWRRHYNTVRPHSALGYRPPAPEAFMPIDQRPTMH